MNKVFSKNFVEKFKQVLIKMYGYEEYMEFLVLPFKKLSYLPLLNYTDRINVDDLLELSKENYYQIRVLNFKYNEFKENDPVVMRINIENKTMDELYKNLKSKRRNLVNKSLKNNFRIEKGNSDEFIERFYKVFSNTMYKHGTPVFDKKLFVYLRDEFQENNIYYIVYDGYKVIGAMCMLFDKEIAWYPWGGVESEYNKKLAGYFIYWKVLEDVVNQNRYKIFDFGRSGYKSGTYHFKSQFGAYPVKIDILKNKEVNIYSKYSLATTIWKKLPKSLVDFVGPKLCKYLEDL